MGAKIAWPTFGSASLVKLPQIIRTVNIHLCLAFLLSPSSLTRFTADPAKIPANSGRVISRIRFRVSPAIESRGINSIIPVTSALRLCIGVHQNYRLLLSRLQGIFPHICHTRRIPDCKAHPVQKQHLSLLSPGKHRIPHPGLSTGS